MFPKPHNIPPSLAHRPVYRFVAVFISPNFFPPEFLVGLRFLIARWTPMPETPVYEDGHLKISADKQIREGDDFIHREIHRSAFSRWFSVDEEVYEVNNINANLADGILSITIPKKEEAVKPLPRKIEVT